MSRDVRLPIATARALAYALHAGRLRDRNARPATARWLNRAGGGMRLAMAAKTATLKRAA